MNNLIVIELYLKPIYNNVCHGKCQRRPRCHTIKLFVKFSFELKSSMVASPVEKFMKLLFVHAMNPRTVGSVVEWLKHRTDDQHGLGSKPTYAILLCPWERHFTALSPAWWS